MLKIAKLQMEGGGMQFALIGRLQGEHVSEMRELIRQARSAVVLDLRELHLVDRSAVQFLASCESDGVVLRNCAPYIRDWVTREAGKQLPANGDED
jgi:anti-anti-sigma regulatory factor